MNGSRHVNNIALGANRFSRRIWDMLLAIPPHAPISLFYAAMSPLLVYLRLRVSETFGLIIFERTTGISWVWLVVVFAICGWITAQQRNPRVYALATIPMASYAMFLAHGLLVGEIALVGATGVVYLLVAVLATLGTIRYYAELQRVKTALDEHQNEIERLRALCETDKSATNERTP